MPAVTISSKTLRSIFLPLTNERTLLLLRIFSIMSFIKHLLMSISCVTKSNYNLIDDLIISYLKKNIKYMLKIFDNRNKKMYYIKAFGLRRQKTSGWRNWQTRTFEGRMVNTVWVQVSFSTPKKHFWFFKGAFCFQVFSNYIYNFLHDFVFWQKKINRVIFLSFSFFAWLLYKVFDRIIAISL